MQIKKSGPDDLKKATGAGTAAVTGFAGMVHPLLGIAVGMAAAYFGPAIERRQDRAKELIQYVQDHISEFTPEILGDQVFQDGFVLLMEKYIRERNEDKRVILQKILRGYIQAPDLLDYPLEEMADLVSRIRMSDVAVLRAALQEEARSGKFNPSTDPIPYNPNSSFMLREDPNAVSRLIYFGLLHEDRSKSGPQVREYDDKNFLYVWISPTGRAFATYIDQA
jgi:hypothetical protein